VTHYELLGVLPQATSSEIREAYRAQARIWHPDQSGTQSADKMARLNEAYRILSDPGRRAAYDRDLKGPQVTYSGSAAGRSSDRESVPRGYDEINVPVAPARFPWRFLLFMASIGVSFVLINAAFMSPAPQRPVDGVARPGSCVRIEPNGDARVVRCSGAGDLVVHSLIPASQICPVDTLAHRDAQGLGTVCVTRRGP
jgi:hypothetical protein